MTGKPFDPGQPVAIFSSRNAIGRGSNLSELAFLMHGAHGRMELVDPNHDPDGQFARACLDRGAYLSFAGTVTFKNNDHLRDALILAPLDRVLVETDAPYLTPVPLRGKPNASYLIPHTARFLAATLGTDLERMCQALNDNADAAFGGGW